MKSIIVTLCLILSIPAYCSEYEGDNPPQHADATKERLSTTTCIALNSYHETRGESDVAVLMVIGVVFNRVESPNYPNTICETVMQNKQFSWLTDGRSDAVHDKHQWKRMYQLAEYALMNKDFVMYMTQGADHYHATRIQPYWSLSRRFRYIATVDNHIFYRRD